MLYRWKEPSCPRAVVPVSLLRSFCWCASAYRRADGAAVGGDTLGGEVDTVGGLELDLKGS
jgi:hypothetical protein